MPDNTRQTGQRVTIVAQRPGSAEVAWLRFLLGDRAGEVVEDPDCRLVRPYSVMVCDRVDQLRHKALASVRRIGSVGLLHVSDKRYRSRLDAYGSFGFVWRTYYHSGLTDMSVRQLPLGPAAVRELAIQPSTLARRRPVERLYTWSFAGQLGDTGPEMLAAFRQIDGGQEQVGAELDQAITVDVLGDSVFVPCAAEEGHLETHRIYEALELGAIPVLERRRWLDYFHGLFGSHPLPTVQSWTDAPALVAGLLKDQARLAALQDQVLTWWTGTKQSLRSGLHDDVDRCFTSMLSGAERNGTPLDRPAPRWRGRVEMLRHRPPGELLPGSAKRREKRRS